MLALFKNRVHTHLPKCTFLLLTKLARVTHAWRVFVCVGFVYT